MELTVSLVTRFSLVLFFLCCADPADRPEFLELVDLIGDQIEIDTSDIHVAHTALDTESMYVYGPTDSTISTVTKALPPKDINNEKDNDNSTKASEKYVEMDGNVYQRTPQISRHADDIGGTDTDNNQSTSHYATTTTGNSSAHYEEPTADIPAALDIPDVLEDKQLPSKAPSTLSSPGQQTEVQYSTP